MKTKIIGIGQCGSYVVYDILAHLFDGTPSKQLRSEAGQPSYSKLLQGLTDKLKGGWNKQLVKMKIFFEGRAVATLPSFWVLDGNRNNALISGLNIPGLKGTGSLDGNSLIRSVELKTRDTGCTFGQLGEYAFGADQETLRELRIAERSSDLTLLVFASGGGSGSGGAVAIGRSPDAKDSAVFNVVVTPSLQTRSRRLQWNTGRCLWRLSERLPNRGTVLFSNAADDPEYLQSVNDRIRDLAIRTANFSYRDGVAVVGTDFDKQDFLSFLAGKTMVVGLSSVGLDESLGSTRDAEELVTRSLRSEAQRRGFGLSIDIGNEARSEFFDSVSKAVLIVGVPKEYTVGNGEAFSDALQNRLLAELGKTQDFDMEVYSYGALNEIELTLFLRHRWHDENVYVKHFLECFLRHRKGETTELEYLEQEPDDDNEIVEDCRMVLESEIPIEAREALFGSIELPKPTKRGAKSG